MEQNPYSRVAGVANVNNGFIDFKGGLKQVQITPDPFY
jgi:hypothetical protein